MTRGDWLIGITPRESQVVLEATVAEDDDTDNHVTCCEDDDLGLCGKDLSGHAWNEGAVVDCVICAELEDLPLVDGECQGCPLNMIREGKR